MVLSTIWTNGAYDIWKIRRLEEGMGELTCKPAGTAISEVAARAINLACAVRCVVCPPDEHPKDVRCEWEFELLGTK